MLAWIMLFGFIETLIFNEWLLYDMKSPSASNSRGFARGSIFIEDGTMVASVAQEGLMRKLVKS